MIRRVRCALVRGGTSRGVFLLAEDLPAVGSARDELLKRLIGVSSHNHVDGLGGGHPQTSKVAIIGPPSRSDADVDYTFAQLGVGEASISYAGNCGNILTGVGPFALDHGFVTACDPMVVVRVHNTNTRTIIYVEVPVRDGTAETEGDYRIDGVPGTGARIMLDFVDAVGTATGELLPTREPSNAVEIEGLGRLVVSLVDVGNPTIFVRARDIGLAGDEPIDGLTSILGGRRAGDFNVLEAIRGAGAVSMGLVGHWREAAAISPFLPFLAIVDEPRDGAAAVDLVARFYTAGVVHPACPGAASVCLAAAARLPGTIVAAVARPRDSACPFRFAHPTGTMEVEIVVGPDGSLRRAAIGRTQRKLMEGVAFVRTSA
jgi:methylitaconate Delta-isomerase